MHSDFVLTFTYNFDIQPVGKLSINYVHNLLGKPTKIITCHKI